MAILSKLFLLLSIAELAAYYYEGHVLYVAMVKHIMCVAVRMYIAVLQESPSQVITVIMYLYCHVEHAVTAGTLQVLCRFILNTPVLALWHNHQRD